MAIVTTILTWLAWLILKSFIKPSLQVRPSIKIITGATLMVIVVPVIYALPNIVFTTMGIVVGVFGLVYLTDTTHKNNKGLIK